MFTNSAVDEVPKLRTARNMESFYLCYQCGETFWSKSSYDEHLFLHQVISFCYQIHAFETSRRGSKVFILVFCKQLYKD